MIVNKSEMSVIGLIFGIKYRLVPLAVLDLDQHEPGQHARDEWNAEIDEYALRYLSDCNIYHDSLEPKPDRKHGYEDIGVHGKEKHLEYRIKRHKTSGVFRITAGKVVPDDHHRDAPCEADHDETDHVFGIGVEKDDRKNEHQNGTDDPVLDEREAKDFLISEYFAELLILDLRKWRVHHQDKTDGNGNVGRANLEAVDEGFRFLKEIAETNTEGHRREDPECKKPVHKRKSFSLMCRS